VVNDMAAETSKTDGADDDMDDTDDDYACARFVTQIASSVSPVISTGSCSCPALL
jgi:hypothetical protein